MKKKVLRILAVLLIFSICTSLLPSSVLAVTAEESAGEKTPTIVDSIAGTATAEDIYGVLDPSIVPAAIDYNEAVEKNHIARCYEDEGTDLNKIIFLNIDGTKTMYVFDFPVKYVDDNGNIQDIRLEIADSTVNAGEFETAANDTVTTFSAQFTDGIALEGNDTEIRLIPILPLTDLSMTTMSTTNIATPTATAQRIDADTVAYPYDAKTTVEYSLTYTGFKEDIVVSEYTGQTTYPFRLLTNGLALEEIDGSFFLVDDQGNIEASIGDIIIFTADERNNAFGNIEPKTIVENQEYLLNIVVDADYLADPATTYPIRIDPTIEIKYSNNGDGAVEDITISTNTNFSGSHTSLYVGRRSTEGIARALMRFPGLNLSGLAGATITSATVRVRDLMCESNELAISCHVFTGNIWDANSATWANVSPNSYVSTPLSTNTMSWSIGNALASQYWYTFDITTAVQGWIDGNYTQSKGIMFKVASSVENGSTINNRTFGSYNRSSYQPSLSVTYTLRDSTVTIREGDTSTLSTTGITGTVTWASNNTSVATVTASGVVTGIRAGHTTVTASVNGVVEKTFHVYVAVANGVYYITNLNSNYCLHVSQGGIANYTDVYQYNKSSETSSIYVLRQMWKVCYLGEGRYSIRPMNKLNTGLDVTGNNVDIFNIGETDSLSSVPSYGQWTIEWYSTGYIFKNNGNSNYTMQVENASKVLGTTVIVNSYNTSLNCRWGISLITSPPSGAYWYDISSQTISGTTANIRYIYEGSTTNASNIGLIPVLYSGSSNNQTFTWSSNNSTVASVNSSSGLISANLPGTATITATSQYGSYKITFPLQANSLDPFHSSNIQYMRFVQIKGTNWWGLGGETDHTINIVKSTQLADDYCVIHDNINTGYYRALYINNELRTTLNNLEAGYQEHYSIIPLFNTTTTEENAAHSAKGETDQLVDAGYFAAGSSEYYGVWAYNYVSSLNLLDYWKGIIDTATAAFQVYLTLTTFYYSYISTLNTNNIQVTSTQYQNASSVLEDIDDAMYGMNYTNRTTISAESRNTVLAQQGYTSPVPYKPQTPVVQYQQTSSTQYVRVFSGEHAVGKWLMKYSDIQGLTPAQIQSKFALPHTPTHYCFVNVPAGTTIYVGVVNQSSVSGTLQYELATNLPVTSFGTPIALP